MAKFLSSGRLLGAGNAEAPRNQSLLDAGLRKGLLGHARAPLQDLQRRRLKVSVEKLRVRHGKHGALDAEDQFTVPYARGRARLEAGNPCLLLGRRGSPPHKLETEVEGAHLVNATLVVSLRGAKPQIT